ncbi:MAG: S8 family serine peptidase, partial [Pseudomonadota bacterium]
GHFTITSPANSRKVITVGSVTDGGRQSRNDDTVSTYSSRGPTLMDHVLKPDLVAPGNRVVAAATPGSTLKGQLADQRICLFYCDSYYLELSGTSMAAALVSATAALMLADDPSLTPATVKARLMMSARKLHGDWDPIATGAGALDVQKAIEAEEQLEGEALSPRMARSEEGAVLLIEDTAQLWGDDRFANRHIWPDGHLWKDGYMQADGYLWFDGYLWADGFLWFDGYLWADGFLWFDGYMWFDGFLWFDAVSNADPLYGNSMEAYSVNDDGLAEPVAALDPDLVDDADD